MRPDLPRVATILQLAQDPALRFESLQAELESSPELPSEIVRLANSSIYGMQGRIRRLDRALLILGPRTVAEIAASLLVARGLRRLEIGTLSGALLLRHSLETAVCAQFAARRVAADLEREAYLAGLLHDLGVCAMHAAHGKHYTTIVSRAIREQRPLDGLEREIFGETHAERLGQAASQWGLPERLVSALACHHDPDPGSQPPGSLAALVREAHTALVSPEFNTLDATEAETLRSRVLRRVDELEAELLSRDEVAAVGGAGFEPAARAL